MNIATPMVNQAAWDVENTVAAAGAREWRLVAAHSALSAVGRRTRSAVNKRRLGLGDIVREGAAGRLRQVRRHGTAGGQRQRRKKAGPDLHQCCRKRADGDGGFDAVYSQVPSIARTRVTRNSWTRRPLRRRRG